MCPVEDIAVQSVDTIVEGSHDSETADHTREKLLTTTLGSPLLVAAQRNRKSQKLLTTQEIIKGSKEMSVHGFTQPTVIAEKQLGKAKQSRPFPAISAQKAM